MRKLIIICLLLSSLYSTAQRQKILGKPNLHYYLPFALADTFKLVTDHAYDATAWNGNLEVPTKNAIRDKIESLAAVLKGTANWTPGIVAAGSSATTTLAVTGAALGDPVTISKTSGAYSNGEVYDAFVSATNTVTIRVHNVSTGSANYNTAEDYNVIVLKY